MKKSIRSMLRSGGLLPAALLLLALGIGATVALFSVAHGVLLAPLPYQEPERLVRAWSELTARGVAHFPESPVNLEDYRTQATLFEGIVGVSTAGAVLSHAEAEPRYIQTANGSWDFLRVLGIAPMLGRGFSAEDGVFSATDRAPGARFPGTAFSLPRVALISHGLWRNEFGGSADVLGRFVQLNGADVEVIGVLPAGFRLHMAAVAGVADDPDIWLPLRVDFSAAPRNNVFLNVVARLRPGVSLAQARAELEAIAERIYDVNPVMRTAGTRLWVVPYADDLVADVRGPLLALFGAACFVLLIACINVASLLLVRASTRERELAVRHALGAGRWRLLRQLLAESAALAGIGTLLGIAVAWLGLHALLQVASGDIPRLDTVKIDAVALSFALAAAVATTLVAGLPPAWRVARAASASTLRERSSNALGGGRGLRSGLIVGEIALSFALLIGAGLMMRSFVALVQTDTGFDHEDVLTFQLYLPAQRYPDFPQRRDLIYALQERLSGLPMVESAAATTPLPLSGQPFNGRYSTVPPTDDESTPYRQANYRVVLPGWFQTMRTPLLAGRNLSREDEMAAAPVVVVDDVMAAVAWPGADPIGQRIWLRLQQPEPEAFEVVGVVRRQLQDNLHEPPRETVYFTAGSAGLFGANSWAVRARGDAEGLLTQIRRELAAIDPSLPLAKVRGMGEYVDAAISRTRFALQLIGAFGIAALVIAAIGLYAAIQGLVRQGQAEIGLRMSVGASAGDIFRLFVRRGLSMAVVGVAVGLLAALFLSGSLAALLVNTSPNDPVTFVSVTTVFLLIAFVASALPALRAARMQPMVVLRDD